MGVVVTADRTEIDDCEDATDWSGGSTNDAFNLEGTFCLGEKVSQTTGAENMYTFPGANPDMTGDFIVMTMQVTGKPDTIAAGGYRILADDGNTDRATWYVGGSDTSNEKWGYFVVDPSTAPTYLNGTLNSVKAVTSITRSGTTATVTTTAVHGMATGDYAVIDGAAESDYNGSWSITVLTTTTFTYVMAADPGASASGTITLFQGIDFTDIDKVGVQFKVVTKAVGNTPNALWDICWYGTGLKVVSTTDSVTLSRSSTTVTVASTGHGLVVGEKVRIAGAVQTDYNGDWTIATVPGANSYTYEVSTTPTSPATGTITSRVHATWQHLADASDAGFWGLVIQTQGVNFVQGRFILGSNGGAADLLFVDGAFKVIFRENAFLPFTANNILPAQDLTGDLIDIEWTNGLISAFNTEWAWDTRLLTDFEPNLSMDGVTFEGSRVFNCYDSVSHTYIGCRWNNILIMDPSNSTLTDCQLSNSPSNGLGVLWPNAGGNITNMTFVNNPFGVTITQVVDQTFDNLVFGDISGQFDVLFTGATDITVSNINGSNANSVLEVGAGALTFIDSPVVTKITIEEADGTLIENARVFLETGDDGTTGFPYQDAVTTLTQAAGVATLTASAVHGLTTGDKVVIRGADEEPYNSVVTITVTSTTIFTFPIDSAATTPAGGTPVFSYVPIQGLTDASGIISSSKAWPASQSLIEY